MKKSKEEVHEVLLKEKGSLTRCQVKARGPLFGSFAFCLDQIMLIALSACRAQKHHSKLRPLSLLAEHQKPLKNPKLR